MGHTTASCGAQVGSQQRLGKPGWGHRRLWSAGLTALTVAALVPPALVWAAAPAGAQTALDARRFDAPGVQSFYVVPQGVNEIHV
ncbi:MAG: hypothetical protein M3133_10220, partial [Actinomycetota bacterium]|nr:hypothetical protein [Actinomycetota bacterium]